MKKLLYLSLTIATSVFACGWFGNSKAKQENLDVEEEKFYADFSFVSEEVYRRDILFLTTVISNNQVLLRKVMQKIRQTNITQKSEYRKDLENMTVDGLNKKILEDKNKLDKLKQMYKTGKMPRCDFLTIGYCPNDWPDID